MNQRIIIFTILLYLASSSYSQKILRISSIEEANALLQDYIEVYVDSTNSLEFCQISSGEYHRQFIPMSMFKDETSSEYTYWLRFLLDYEPYNYETIALFSGNNDFVEAYSQTDSSVQLQKTGSKRKGTNNDEILSSSNLLLIEGKGPTEIYLKINAIITGHPRFDITFHDLENIIRSRTKSNLFQAFFHGIMLLMVLYGFFLYYHKREKVYLFYALYILLASIWAYQIFMYRFMDNLSRELNSQYMLFGFFSFHFYLRFLRTFLNTPLKLPKWDRVLKTAQRFMWIACVVLFILSWIPFISPAMVSLYVFVIIVFCVLVFSFLLKIIRSKIPFTRIVWTGTSMLVIGSVVSIITFYGQHYNLHMPLKIGILLELMIFTYGVSLRYKIIEEEKVKIQARLINQLKENAEIQERANRELEGKVKRRTAEISHKNDMLSQQNEEIEAQRNQLEIQHDLVLAQKNEIVNSITYAQRIQSAMLPPESYFSELLNDNFILYKPRDIVSGDFYWIRQVNQSIILAAADCTGHGVPGALLSMLGMSYLDEIVQRREITQASQVLNELRTQIKLSLRQHGYQDESKDGMDIALLVLDIKTKMIQYSGARNPLHLVRDKQGHPELEVIKADPMPVGYYPAKDRPFTNHNIQLEIGDTFYLFSDGYVDQKGGENNRKFLIKNFKRLLVEINEQAMHIQRETLEKTLKDWMGDQAQVDDILVIGIRV